MPDQNVPYSHGKNCEVGVGISGCVRAVWGGGMSILKAIFERMAPLKKGRCKLTSKT